MVFFIILTLSFSCILFCSDILRGMYKNMCKSQLQSKKKSHVFLPALVNKIIDIFIN